MKTMIADRLTGRELLGIQRFNRFVVEVYLQSWYQHAVVMQSWISEVIGPNSSDMKMD